MTTTLLPRSKQAGFAHHWLLIGLIVSISIFAFFKIGEGKVAAASTIIKSGITGYCLDDYKNRPVADNMVELWGCNDSAAQNWSVNGDQIVHNSACLSVQKDGKATGSAVVANNCDGSPGQVWLKNKTGLFNPNSNLCLAASSPHRQLTILPCDASIPGQIWAVSSLTNGRDSSSATCPSSKGERIACYAEKEWAVWQSGRTSHNDLLNTYTDGAPYEAWCADFVSYVYKEAGYPFTQAYDGWDENNANNVQNYGFTFHPASSGYMPKPGDIAYFDYNGGHVEIVVSGGKTPTFIYGNSATTDPTTGNGQMKANTIVNDGPEGKLVYYLSPI